MVFVIWWTWCTILQILKPAFTVLVDHKMKSFLLLIRGTHSVKDTLTAVTGAVVPFHHTVVHDGGVSNLVLGYAHCGMVAAARWIAKLATPCLEKALSTHPDYKLTVPYTVFSTCASFCFLYLCSIIWIVTMNCYQRSPHLRESSSFKFVVHIVHLDIL